MKQHLCRVIDNRILWADAQLLTLDAPELARAIRPGQLALARDTTTLDPYLRRTLWLYHVEGDHVAFTFSSRDPLAVRARPGDLLDLYAPIGHAIELESNAKHSLLIGEGTQTGRLIALAHDAIAHEREVVLVTTSPIRNADRKEQKVGAEPFPVHLLSPEIEYHSEGELDSELISWADAIVASGSTELYRALAESIRVVRYRLEPGFARVLVDMPMPCGMGACCACAVDTTRGVRFACVEGPAFDLAEFENRMTR